ncbi:MAG TPA: hypothetical protein VG943_06725 [Caulobacterales bacterium]|nr:hypothetical protein [Caulobacterales bacterium]
MHIVRSHHPHPPEAFIAAARMALWGAVSATLAVAALAGDTPFLRAMARQFERVLEALIILLAAKHIPMRRPPQLGGRRPLHKLNGFRRVPAKAMGWRALMRGLGVRRRGDVKTRLLHLLVGMAAPQRLVAKLLKRARAGLKGARFVATAPPDALMCGALCADAPAPRDSS